MTRDGCTVIGSDMDIVEPSDLWERYLDCEFQSLAPRGSVSENIRDLRLTCPNNKVANFGEPAVLPNLRAIGHNYDRNQKLYADHASRGWTADLQLEAMGLEGINVAVLYPSRGLGALIHPYREPRFAAAIARAYNDWLYECFCRGGELSRMCTTSAARPASH